MGALCQVHDFVLVTLNGSFRFRYIQTVKGLKQNEFVRDIHVQELLAFPAGTDLHKHKLFLSGDIILQDKVDFFAFPQTKVYAVNILYLVIIVIILSLYSDDSYDLFPGYIPLV